MKIAEFLVEFHKILKLPSKEKKSSVNEFVDKYTNILSVDERETLQRCLKAFNLPFNGDQNIVLNQAPFYEQTPPATFGAHFNKDLYQKAYALASFVYLFEKNGIPEEHATKMAVIFKDVSSMINYLKQIAKNALNKEKLEKHQVRNVFHNAFLFTLPNAQTPGFDFSIWKELANTRDHMLRAEFKEMLPFGWELQQLVKSKVEEAKRSQIKPDRKKIEDASKELEKLLKEYKDLEHNKADHTTMQKERYNQLTRLVSNKKRELAKLNYGKFLKNLSLLEMTAFYEEHKIQSSAAYNIFTNNGIPAQYYAQFKELNRQDAGNHIPDITIDGRTIGHPGYYLRKVPVQEELEAARAACFGKLTGCCQSLSGEAGQACVIHGLTSPNGGFYVVCKGDVQDPKWTDKVVGQSWVWRSQNEAMVFDSVEVPPAATVVESSAVVEFFHSLGERLVLEKHTELVVCGSSSGISDSVGVTTIIPQKEKFKDYNGYCDSKDQRVIYDIRHPYYFYNIHNSCKDQVNHFIEDLSKSKTSLKDNKEFIEILNFVKVNEDTSLFEKIKAEMLKQQKVVEFNQIDSLIDQYVMSNVNDDFKLFNIIVENYYLINIVDRSGMTPLMRAVISGNRELCLKLIEKGSNINVKDKCNYTPLMYAVEKGEIELSLNLIKNGADVNALLNDYGITPLSLAAQNGHVGVCKVLLAKGANVNAKDTAGRTPLLATIDSNGLNLNETIVELIVNGADVNAPDNNARTPLILAVENGETEVCLKLIEYGANVNVQDKFGVTPLMIAVGNGHVEICAALIANGANVNIKDSNGNTPLMIAVEGGHIEIYEALIANGAIEDTKDSNGNSLLLVAVQQGHTELCLKMIKNGEDINELQNGNGIKLLSSAAQNNLKEVCELLIMFADADALSTNKELLLRMNDPKINEALEKRQAELQTQNASRNRKKPLTPMLVGTKNTEPSVKPKLHKSSSGSELPYEKKHLNR